MTCPRVTGRFLETQARSDAQGRRHKHNEVAKFTPGDIKIINVITVIRIIRVIRFFGVIGVIGVIDGVIRVVRFNIG